MSRKGTAATCVVDGCNEVHRYADGYCHQHRKKVKVSCRLVKIHASTCLPLHVGFPRRILSAATCARKPVASGSLSAAGFRCESIASRSTVDGGSNSIGVVTSYGPSGRADCREGETLFRCVRAFCHTIFNAGVTSVYPPTKDLNSKPIASHAPPTTKERSKPIASHPPPTTKERSKSIASHPPPTTKERSKSIASHPPPTTKERSKSIASHPPPREKTCSNCKPCWKFGNPKTTTETIGASEASTCNGSPKATSAIVSAKARTSANARHAQPRGQEEKGLVR
jgi:hypothetical protein